MAKRKKLQDQNPPRRVEIRGQDHLLAYITPEEAQMLMANGGAGQPGPMGIPAFFDVGEGAGGYDSGGKGDDKAADTAGGAGDPDAGIGGGGSTSGNANAGSGRGDAGDLGMSPGRSQAQFGTPEFAGMTETQAYNTLGTGGGSEQAQQVQADIVSQLTRAGNQGANQFTSVPYVNAQINNLINEQLQERMQQAQSGYGIPSLLGKGLGAVGQFTLGRIGKGIAAGGRPVFDSAGNIAGVFNEGPFGFGEVYTGMPVEGVEGTGYDAGGGESGFGDIEDVKPVNPVTGQCDEGYMFDPDLQACRLDTGGVVGGGVIGDTFAPGAYARMGLLDVAPTGLPGFSEQYGIPSQDFDEANLAFRRGTATQAGIFQDPYDLTGYSLLG